MTTTVGFLALLFWGAILFWSNSSPSVMGLLLLGLAIFALVFMTAVALLKHRQNPPIDAAVPVDLEGATRVPSYLKRTLIWIEGLGFFGGLLAPVIVISGVLAIATLIGFVNFTFFGN